MENEEDIKIPSPTELVSLKKDNRKSIIIFTIVAIVCISIFGISLAQKQLQNDTFYTIKVGEHIAKTKTIDMKDPFSWHEDLTYTYPHWLYDLGTFILKSR